MMMEQYSERQLVLNLDTLLNIMSMSSRDTASRMMRASRELYSHGPTHVVQKEVLLKRKDTVTSFVAFMMVDYPYRLRFLENLHISTGRLSGGDAEVLERFLLDSAQVMIVRQLTIDHAEQFFLSMAGLSGAFSLLHTLDSLTLNDIGRRAEGFLISLKSHLVSADLSMLLFYGDEFDDDNEDGNVTLNPILQLRNSQDTLGHLHVQRCNVFTDLETVYEERYPHILELSLTSDELPCTTHLARAFPNVHTLQFECEPRPWEQLGADLEVLHALRVTNEGQQTRFGMWTALRCVQGTLVDLYLLGLLCPVEQLHIDGPATYRSMLRPVIGVATPAYLSLTHFDADIVSESLFGRAGTHPQWLASVRALEIQCTLGFEIDPDEIDMPLVLDDLVEGIGRAQSVRSVGVTFFCFALAPRNAILLRGIPPHTRAPLNAAEQCLLDLDLDAYAERMRAAAPTLQTVAVSLRAHRTRPDASVMLGDASQYEEGAVERIPLRHGSAIA
ncbi:hypothetical protein C8Q77DRAFT_1086200 [Trametes polyzona]|nr:hypothetical protein C8Q77DRAFT_1086200 [Trametes polyzona]